MILEGSHYDTVKWDPSPIRPGTFINKPEKSWKCKIGKRKEIIPFINDEISGIVTSYSSEADLPLSEICYKKGKRDGFCRIYYPNGITRENSLYSKGIKNGQENLFYPNGKRQSIGQYKNGLKNGFWRYFYETGKRKTEGNYKNDKKTGKWKNYSENEKIINEETF